MDLAFEAVNRRGKYQVVLIIITFLTPFTSMIISAGFPFLTASPKIFCRMKDAIEPEFEVCTVKEICKALTKFEFIKNYEESLHNWAYEWDLFCDQGYLVPMITTCFFTGAIIGSMSLATFPDKYGRSKIFKYLIYLLVFIHFNLVFLQSYQHMLITTLLSGITTYTSTLLSLMVTEVIDKSISGLVLSFRSASFGFLGILVSLYYMQINHFNLLFVISFILTLIILYLVSTYLVESPRWLNSKNRVEEAIAALSSIAKVNRSEEPFKKFLEVNSDVLTSSATTVKEVKAPSSFMDVLYYPSQWKKFLILCYCWFTMTFCFYGLFTGLDRKGGNMFLESIVTYTGEAMSELMSGWCAGIFGRVIVIKVLSFMGGSFFILYHIFEDKTLKSIFVFIASFGFSGAVNLLYIYTPETFPTSIRAVVFTFLYFLSRLGAIAIPIIARQTTQTPLLIGVMSILVGYCFNYLEETLGHEMLDDIPEKKRQFSALSTLKTSKKNLSMIKNSFIYGRHTVVSDTYFKLSFKDDPLVMKNMAKL